MRHQPLITPFLKFRVSHFGTNNMSCMIQRPKEKKFKCQLSRPQISTLGLQLFNSINGDEFYPIKTWPIIIQQLFWKKPTGDSDTFKLILFFIGNGCSPDVISKWILTFQHWATRDKGVKRDRQLEFIKRNLDSKFHSKTIQNGCT